MQPQVCCRAHAFLANSRAFGMSFFAPASPVTRKCKECVGAGKKTSRVRTETQRWADTHTQTHKHTQTHTHTHKKHKQTHTDTNTQTQTQTNTDAHKHTDTQTQKSTTPPPLQKVQQYWAKPVRCITLSMKQPLRKSASHAFLKKSTALAPSGSTPWPWYRVLLKSMPNQADVGTQAQQP